MWAFVVINTNGLHEIWNVIDENSSMHPEGK
jgi:hypothetical protein